MVVTRFVCIGILAFAVHAFSVIFFVSGWGLQPLVANVLGFCLAFSVSYVGHKNWTFRTDRQTRRGSLARFLVVSVTGFLINESTYALYLSLWPDHYIVGLILTILLASVSTFILSRNWAFSTVGHARG